MHHGPYQGPAGLGVIERFPALTSPLRSIPTSHRSSVAATAFAFADDQATGGDRDHIYTSPQPVGEAEKIFDRLVALKVSTSQLAMHLDSAWRSGIFRQLDELLDPEEWDFSDRLPELASYQTLLRMLLALKPLKRPSLGATSTGEIIAGWVNAESRLTVECLARDQVRWTVSGTLRGQSVKAAGLNRSDLLPQVLAPYPQVGLLGR